METILANIGLNIAYILIAACGLGGIIFSIIDASRSSGSMTKRLIAFGGFVLIVLISFLVTGGERADMHDGVSALRTHIASAGLTMFYITGFLAIAALLISIILESLR